MITSNGIADKIKDKIRDTAEKSKERIHEIIDTNSQFIGSTLNANKKIANSIGGNRDQKQMEDNLTMPLNGEVKKTGEFAKGAVDNIINAYARQMELNIDFNRKVGENVSNQIISLFKMQSSGIDKLKVWVSEW
jgi:hypothetical protein